MKRCVCGAPYPDSDGEEPCHYGCTKCDRIIFYDIANDDMIATQLCPDCYDKYMQSYRDDCSEERVCAGCTYSQQQFCHRAAYAEDVEENNE